MSNSRKTNSVRHWENAFTSEKRTTPKSTGGRLEVQRVSKNNSRSERTQRTYSRGITETIALKSPYNFVEFNEGVMEAYSNPDSIPRAEQLSDELLSGEISYQITARTPIMFEHGMDSLTASMVRGLVRSNLQILSFSSVDNDITDINYRYRNFRDKYYESIMGTCIHFNHKSGAAFISHDNIRAGTLYKKDGLYYIRTSSAFGGKGYWTVNLAIIQSGIKDWRVRFNVSWKKTKNVFDTLNEKTLTTGRYRRSKTIREPFIKKVSWQAGYGNEVYAIGEEGIYQNKGWLLNPGFIYSSTSMYLIGDESESTNIETFQLSQDDIISYKKHLNNPAGNRTVQQISVYRLPSSGEEKPVFYVKYAGQCDFGFTKLFPIRWRHSVKDGIPSSHKEKIIDYTMAVFGFHGYRAQETGRSVNYGGRVSFGEPRKLDKRQTITDNLLLATPKTQSVVSYIHDDNKLGYNSDDFRLNGIKQYWLKESIDPHDSNIPISKFTTLVTGDEAGTKYQGKIRFYNLKEDELGLLLWSIGLNDGCEQNIGAGKPYGYGRIAVKLLDIKRFLYSPIHIDDGFISSLEQISLDSKYYIRLYQNRLNLFLEGGLENNQRLQDFFLMKSKEFLPDRNRIIYEDLAMYRRWRICFPKVTDIATNTKWLVIPKHKAKKIEDIPWESFRVKPPSEMQEMHPEIDIYNAYKDLTDTLELFRCNKNYYIREEIYKEYLEVTEAVESFLKQKNDGGGYSSIYETIEENIQTCIREIGVLEAQMEGYEKQFRREGIPILEAFISEPFFDASEKAVFLTLQLRIPESSVPVRINRISLLEDQNCRYSTDERLFITGWNTYDKMIKIPVQDDEVKRTYILLKLHIQYQYRLEDSSTVLEYDNDIDIPVLSGDYQRLENPYSSWLGNPVSDKNMFFGRDNLLQEIMYKVENCSNEHLSGRNIIVYGQKRTGKSTIMYFLKQDLQGYDDDKYIIVDIGNVGSVLQVDLDQEGSGSVSLRLFCRRMIDAVEDELSDNFEDLYDDLEDEGFGFPRLRDVSDVEALRICENFYRKLSERLMPDKRIILLIDEFTYFYDMIARGYLDDNFMRFWKAFIQNTKICAVLTGQDFMEDFIDRFANEFGASDSIRISYLDYESAREMIQKPFLTKNDYEGFTESCVDEIIRLTAGSAFYVMHLCSGLVSYLNEKKNRRVVTVNVLMEYLNYCWLNVDSTKRIDKAFFESLYNDGTHPEWDDDNLALLHEIAVLDSGSGVEKTEVLSIFNENGGDKSLLSNVSVSFAKDKIQRLIFRDVLSEKNGMLKIKVGLFQEWLKKIY